MTEQVEVAPEKRKRGRPKGSVTLTVAEDRFELAKEARKHMVECVQIAINIARSSNSDSAKMAAINFITDRGYGRPSQAIEVTGKDGNPLEVQHNFDVFSQVLNASAVSTVVAAQAKEESIH